MSRSLVNLSAETSPLFFPSLTTIVSPLSSTTRSDFPGRKPITPSLVVDETYSIGYNTPAGAVAEQRWRDQSLLEVVAQQLAQQLLLERNPERANEELLGIVQPSKRGRRKVESRESRKLRSHGGLLA